LQIVQPNTFYHLVQFQAAAPHASLASSAPLMGWVTLLVWIVEQEIIQHLGNISVRYHQQVI
jgi:hypothetical protein